MGEWERTWRQVPVSTKVPAHVARRIEMAKDLYMYSYFRYGFLDAAFLYALLAYEAALREVYSDTEAKLEHLIDSADQAGLIPARYPAWKVHALRRVRNAQMHGLAYAPGLVAQDDILTIIDLINCVFDKESRVVCPPLYVPLMTRRRRRDNFLARMTDVDNSILKPGDWLAFVGTQESYGAGTYTCFKCKKQIRLTRKCQELPICRKCMGGSFRYEPAR